MHGAVYRVQGSSFRVCGLGVVFRFEFSGFGIEGLVLRGSGSWYRVCVQGFWFKVWGLGFGVQGSGFRVQA